MPTMTIDYKNIPVENIPGFSEAVLLAVPSQSSTPTEWGNIGGTLTAQTDLSGVLNGKSNTDHTHESSGGLTQAQILARGCGA